ncbi:MAG TPA: Maf family protein [Gammaproteobacteria bacterium]|nr:Maf family protein [Gammaproteobacteria bacterium]
MPPPDRLYLASRSPRRAELLDQLGLAHHVLDADVDEAHRAGETPEAYAERVAVDKAEAGAAAAGLPAAGGLALGADTAIELGGRLLGKPADADEARAYLTALSGRRHDVLSAVAGCDGVRSACRISRTTVTMRVIPPEEIEAYLATGEAADKAGAYAVQGRAAVFVERLEGSYSAVMGLPLYDTDQILKQFGWSAL